MREYPSGSKAAFQRGHRGNSTSSSNDTSSTSNTTSSSKNNDSDNNYGSYTTTAQRAKKTTISTTQIAQKTTTQTAPKTKHQQHKRCERSFTCAEPFPPTLLLLSTLPLTPPLLPLRDQTPPEVVLLLADDAEVVAALSGFRVVAATRWVSESLQFREGGNGCPLLKARTQFSTCRSEFRGGESD